MRPGSPNSGRITHSHARPGHAASTDLKENWATWRRVGSTQNRQSSWQHQLSQLSHPGAPQTPAWTTFNSVPGGQKVQHLQSYLLPVYSTYPSSHTHTHRHTETKHPQQHGSCLIFNKIQASSHAALEKNEIKSSAATRMELGAITLSELRSRKSDITCSHL